MKRTFDIGRRSEKTELNMAPLIDMIFILLIFFLVTASFVKTAGIEVKKPFAETAEKREKTNLVIGVARDSTIWVEGRMIDIRDIRAYLEQFLMETPKGTVVIAADEESRSEITLLLHDQCQAVGIQEVYIGAEPVSR
jgi:biopolymer transport protein ExbD